MRNKKYFRKQEKKHIKFCLAIITGIHVCRCIHHVAFCIHCIRLIMQCYLAWVYCEHLLLMRLVMLDYGYIFYSKLKKWTEYCTVCVSDRDSLCAKCFIRLKFHYFYGSGQKLIIKKRWWYRTNLSRSQLRCASGGYTARSAGIRRCKHRHQSLQSD